MGKHFRVFSVLVALACSGVAVASSTLRVGNQVLTAGDSAERVTELLGKPSHRFRPRGTRSTRSSGRRRGGTHVVAGNEGGERWQYRRGDHVTTITVVDGRVSDIQDERR